MIYICIYYINILHDIKIYKYFNHSLYINNYGYIYKNISNKAEVRELAASNWISTTCRDIQTAIIKTCAYNNRFALKCAFGESYNDLCPGTIYSPPSYDVRFPSAIMSS